MVLLPVGDICQREALQYAQHLQYGHAAGAGCIHAAHLPAAIGAAQRFALDGLVGRHVCRQHAAGVNRVMVDGFHYRPADFSLINAAGPCLASSSSVVA
jgi:hypothetical protein